MLEDFRLKVFMTVASEGSFTKAASLLQISQPAVSQNISELEKTLGVKLFERLHGEIRLTDQGRLFRNHARRILGSYAEASNLFCQLTPSVIRIHASDEIYTYIYGALEQFMTVHPEIQIQRSEGADCDLSFVLKSAPKNMGGISATHNMISSLFLCCQPSESFAQTRLFSILKAYLADAIS